MLQIAEKPLVASAAQVLADFQAGVLGAGAYPDQVEADFGHDLGGRMVALSGNAPNLVFDLIQRHQISCSALQSGTLRSAISSKGGTEVRASAEQWIRRGGPVSILERDAIYAATGTARYQAAMLDRRGGQLNPLSYARGLARAAPI